VSCSFCRSICCLMASISRCISACSFANRRFSSASLRALVRSHSRRELPCPNVLNTSAMYPSPVRPHGSPPLAALCCAWKKGSMLATPLEFYRPGIESGGGLISTVAAASSAAKRAACCRVKAGAALSLPKLISRIASSGADEPPAVRERRADEGVAGPRACVLAKVLTCMPNASSCCWRKPTPGVPGVSPGRAGT